MKRTSRANGETRCYRDWLSVQDPQETITTTTFSAPHAPLTANSVAPVTTTASTSASDSSNMYPYVCAGNSP